MRVFSLSGQNGEGPTRTLLQALAVTDIIFLLSYVTSGVIPAILESTSYLSDTKFEQIWKEKSSYVWPAKFAPLTASTWLIVYVAFDQYLVVCKPERPQAQYDMSDSDNYLRHLDQLSYLHITGVLYVGRIRFHFLLSRHWLRLRFPTLTRHLFDFLRHSHSSSY